MNLNVVFVSGNLVRDPEVLVLQDNKKVVRFSIALNKSYVDSKGNEREEVCFVSVVVFDQQAESCAKYLKKGDNVFVQGELQTRTWEKDGEKRSQITVKGKQVKFLGKFDLNR